jgi:hypothetical protein
MTVLTELTWLLLKLETTGTVSSSCCLTQDRVSATRASMIGQTPALSVRRPTFNLLGWTGCSFHRVRTLSQSPHISQSAMNAFLSNLDISFDRHYVTTPLQSLLAVISSLLSYFALPPAMGALVFDFLTSKIRSHSLAFFTSLLPNPAFITVKIITMRTALENLFPNLTTALAITRTALVALLSSDDFDLTWNRSTFAAIVTPSRTAAPAASAPSRAWHALTPPELIVLVLAFAFYLFCAYTSVSGDARA